MSPHWRTYIGIHFLGVEHFKSISVDPVFPNLFRYHYELNVDVPLAERLEREASEAGLVTRMMRNPDYRVDYGTIVSCHLTRPAWDKPIVGISTHATSHYFSVDHMQNNMFTLGEATRRAVEASGRRVVLLASNSLSHRHFTEEAEVPEDMSKEHIYHHGQYLWDMQMIELMRAGKSRELIDLMPDFTEQTVAETDSGALTWLIAALDFPTYSAHLHGYGTVIGTGNAVMSWLPQAQGVTP